VIADILFVFPGMSEERLEALELEPLLKRHEQAIARKLSDREALSHAIAAAVAALIGQQ
jgi:hypothetical protein